jgi:hypothetical protein
VSIYKCVEEKVEVKVEAEEKQGARWRGRTYKSGHL